MNNLQLINRGKMIIILGTGNTLLNLLLTSLSQDVDIGIQMFLMICGLFVRVQDNNEAQDDDPLVENIIPELLTDDDFYFPNILHTT